MTTYGTFKRTVYTATSSFNEDYTMYGRPGSTELDEWNRLANGGEYPATTAYLDFQGAVNKWTGTVNGTGIIKALNKYANVPDSYDFKGLNAVVNYILETMKEGGEPDPSGDEMQPRNILEAVTALRLIAR